MSFCISTPESTVVIKRMVASVRMGQVMLW